VTAGSTDDVSNLYRLARLCGVDVDVRDQNVAPEALLVALRALGVRIDNLADASRAHDAHRREIWEWRLEPVAVAWGGTGNGVLRMPADEAHLRIDCNMRLEDGDGHGWGVNLTDVPPFAYEVVDGIDYVAKLLPLRSLATGYHRMSVDLPGHHTEALVISAPVQVYQLEEQPAKLEPVPAILDASGGLSPVELRHSGYESLIERLRQQFAPGSGVVIEDAKAWLRPTLADSELTASVRLRYEVEELLALLSLESHRSLTPIVAREQPGPPSDIDAALERHGIARVDGVAGAQVPVGYPNWRRRIGPSIEELDGALLQSRVLDMLREHRPATTD